MNVVQSADAPARSGRYTARPIKRSSKNSGNDIGAQTSSQTQGERTSGRGKIAKNVSSTAATARLLANGTHSGIPTSTGSARQVAAIW